MGEIPLGERKERRGSGKVKAVSFRVLDAEDEQVSSLQSGKDYYFEIKYLNYTGTPLNNVVFSFDFLDERGNVILLFRTNFTNNNLNLEPDTGYIRCKVNNLPLANGTYHFSIFISHADQEILDWIEDAASVQVDGGDFFGTGNPGLPSMCKILRKAEWFALSS
jgi:lipopolysaccharide transport system ATP-binding protein